MSYYGGGLTLYNLDEIVENYHVPLAEFVPGNIYPIGIYQDFGYLAIDSYKCASGAEEYLVYIDHERLDRPDYLPLSFEM
ncbi:hypothetical protein C8P63_10978 [Melghirimyces profundicolus]|uniref:SUKH superfamily protein n=1 Tax=Melghirimyces profundicolus TaxID=1242148 RepID=A0A2T6BW52_9BACL|nr:hypothetical protein C8P63_10978 [Melghirimyces profundicolus]